MRNWKSLFIALVVSMFSFSNIFAAEVNVAPNQPNALADAITAASAGDVLLLQGGMAYPNEGKLTIDKALTIKAIGTFNKPTDKARVLQIPNASGDRSSQTIELGADIVFVNIYFDGKRSERSSDVQQITVSEPDISIKIDSCVFDRSSQTAIKLNKGTRFFSVTNTIFVNMVPPGSISEGRGIDLREGPHKKVLIQNNTFSNANDRFIRHLKWGQVLCPAIDSLIVDHNTFNQGLGYRPNFQFSSVKYLRVTNNLIINPAMLGTDTVSNRVGEITWMAPEAVTHLGPNGITIFNITEADSYKTVIEMRNNNVYIDPSVTAVLNSAVNVEPAPMFNNEMKAVLGADTATATFSESITFVAPGDLHIEHVQVYKDMTDTVTVIGDEIDPDDVLGAQKKYFFLSFGVDTLDLSYNTDAASYTAADDGLPLGDLNWFPNVTAIEEQIAPMAKEFQLNQNYPNPFNPSTTISFSVPVSGSVKLAVYNVLGQEVAMLVNKELATGVYEYQFNASTLPSGLYFYKLQSSGQTQVKKMMLLK